MALDDLTLMPDTDARKALAGRRIAFSVLAPVGAFAGRGMLRVLRARPLAAGQDAADEEELVELVCGYESYEPLRS